MGHTSLTTTGAADPLNAVVKERPVALIPHLFCPNPSVATTTTFVSPAAPVEYSGYSPAISDTAGCDSTKDLGSYCLSPVDGPLNTTLGPVGLMLNIIHGENTGATVTIGAHSIRATGGVVAPVTTPLPTGKAVVATYVTFIFATGGARTSSPGPTVLLGTCTSTEKKADHMKLRNSTSIVAITTLGSLGVIAISGFA